MNREPSLNDLIGTDATGAERQRLQQVHEMLLEAGPPPELSAELEAGPTLTMTLGKQQREGRPKPRAMLLLAAALAVALVFFAGYSFNGHKSGQSIGPPVITQAFKGTSLVPNAQGTLQVWNSTSAGNWPMKLSVVGLPPLPPRNYYEVYLLRDGKPWGSCGTFRVANSSDTVTVTLSAPYPLQTGDTWAVTRPGAGGAEPGQTVLSPVKA